MRAHLPRFLFSIAFFALCFVGVGESNALTIYRIGGENLPSPAIDAPFKFVQLAWKEVNESQHGRADLLDIAPDFIEPQRLDPTANLTPLIRERGGTIKSNDGYGWKSEAQLDFLFDGDPNTAYLGSGGQYSIGNLKAIWIDLAGVFSIQRIRLSPSPRFMNERFLERFSIGTNDGDPRKDGTRERRLYWRGAFMDFEVPLEFIENTTSILDLELPDTPVRNIVFQAPIGNWEIAEFEIYGEGYVQFASYTSNIIDLGSSATLGSLSWSGHRDPGAVVELRMRSGDDADPNSYWRYTFRGNERSRFDQSGNLLTRDSYENLEGGEKAGITPDQENWEFWTPPLDFEAFQAELVGARPRRFLQFKVDFQARRSESGGRLDYLQFAVSQPPVVSQVLAEIVPAQVEARKITRFTYKLLPQLQKDDLGFDSIEIHTPIRVVKVDSVRIGGVGERFEVVQQNEESFVVQIPRIDVQRTGELIEVVFQAEVFKFGTVFSGKVFDSARPHEVRQRITPGNADDLAESNSLSVALSRVGEEAIQDLRLSASVFTPNGDGINDELKIEYDLVNVEGAVPVVLDLYDLTGKRVREVSIDKTTSGRFSVTWDGADAEGVVLPPGIYLLRLGAETDEKVDTIVRTVSLVY